VQQCNTTATSLLVQYVAADWSFTHPLHRHKLTG